jgi:hypothetical protein
VFHSELLRESGLTQDPDENVIALVQQDETVATSMPAGPELRRFAGAVMAAGHPGASESSEVQAELDAAREALCQTISDDGLVDAAAVIAHFDQLNRIADATGVQVDDPNELFRHRNASPTTHPGSG